VLKFSFSEGQSAVRELSSNLQIERSARRIGPLCWNVWRQASFKRAALLREFLLYVGRQSVRDNSIIIHEQEIGTTVFGRPPVYDTSLDNIVRVNATELRKRLELNFSSEGAEEPVVLEIPRGSYTPIFRRGYLRKLFQK
jgi:hypothetical protein